MKIRLGELKEQVRIVAKVRQVNESKRLIERIVSEKSSLLDKMFGRIDPSSTVDDPKKVAKTLDKTLSNATNIADDMDANALRSTKEINRFHDAVVDAMGKVTSLSDTLGPDRAKEYEKKLIELVKNFYSILKKESDRIDSFLKTVSSDMENAGFDKSMAYRNTKGMKAKGDTAKPAAPGFKPRRPDIMDQGDEALGKVLGTKPTWKKEEETPDLDVDDPEAVRRFLKGGK